MNFRLDRLEALVKNLKIERSDEIIAPVNKNGTPNKTYQLLESILTGAYQKEVDIKEQLFSGSNQDSRFRYLKKQLGTRLVNTIITRPEQKGASYRFVYNDCYKTFSAIKVLISNGVKKLAIDMAEETIKVVRRYEITELVYLLSFELLQHYSLLGNHRKRKYYYKIYQESFSLYQAEQDAVIRFSELSVLLANGKKPQKKEQEIIRTISEDIQHDYTSFSSYKLNFIRYVSAIIRYEIEDNTEVIIQTCLEGINYFDQLTFQPRRSYYFNLFYYMMPSLICQKQYHELNKVFERVFLYSDKGAYNWNAALLYQAIYGFHSKQYIIAATSFNEAIKHKKETPKNLQEQWNIIEAYLYFLRNIERLPKNKSRFRLQRFLNEVPEYSKDKTGANISILILQILILLSRKEKSKVIDRMDALRAYTNKYLKQDNTYRSQCFLKIILQLEKSHFHPIAFQRNTKELFKKIVSSPIKLSELEIEIIPYEHQYQFITDML